MRKHILCRLGIHSYKLTEYSVTQDFLSILLGRKWTCKHCDDWYVWTTIEGTKRKDSFDDWVWEKYPE